MTVYKIVVFEDGSEEAIKNPEQVFYTDEALFDIKHAIEKNLAVYESREDYDLENENFDLDLDGDEDEGPH